MLVIRIKHIIDIAGGAVLFLIYCKRLKYNDIIFYSMFLLKLSPESKKICVTVI